MGLVTEHEPLRKVIGEKYSTTNTLKIPVEGVKEKFREVNQLVYNHKDSVENIVFYSYKEKLPFNYKVVSQQDADTIVNSYRYSGEARFYSSKNIKFVLIHAIQGNDHAQEIPEATEILMSKLIPEA